MNNLNSTINSLLKVPFINKIYSKQFRDFRKIQMVYKPDDLNFEYYSQIKDIGHRELEHQIGRLTNFKNIISECRSLQGDLIEFGSWKGFSLLWIAYFMERNALFNKKLIGLDGFIGLPYADGAFAKGKFANTSLRECRRNILQSDYIYRETKKNIFIEKFLYKEKIAILRYFARIQTKKFCFIHIDCDTSQSAREIFQILIEGDLIADRAFILFDDYGIEPTLRNEISKFIEDQKSHWDVESHSETHLTKNFVFTKKHS